MALRLWLPLNGSLVNQGLSDVTVINNGATINNNGKIGKCYEFSGSSQYIDSGYKESFGTGDFSISVWVKLTQTSGKSYQPIVSNKTVNGTSQGVAIYYNQSQNKFLWSTADGSNATEIWTANTFAASSLNEKWTHIIMVRDSSDAMKGYFYINGVRQELTSIPVIRNVTNTTYNLIIGNIADHSNASYTWTGSICDLRIYDEAVSAKMAKELSKGLVLHYPLSDPYVEDTTNLITTEDCLSSTCYNGATSKYGYGSNSDIYKTVTTFEGRKGTKVYMGTNGNPAFPYVYINNMYTSNGTNSPEYKTLSFDYYTTISTSISPYKLGKGTGTATYKVTNTTTKTGIGTNSVAIPVEPNMWNHIEIMFHGTTDDDAQWGYIQNRPSHTSDISNFWFFANMQLEAKDHATGYTPFGTTRAEDFVYDVSGYGNNGTVTGSLAYSSDTPRYLGSTYFNGSSYISTPAGSFNWFDFNQCTISAWMKPTVKPSGYSGSIGISHNYTNNNKAFAISNHGGNFVVYYNNGSYSAVSSGYALPLNEWHHCVAVLDGTAVALYVDGELKKTQTIDWGTTPISNINIVQVAVDFPGSDEKYTGYYSDIRIYTTALSADDILALYNTPVSIANNGTLMTQGEISEV